MREQEAHQRAGMAWTMLQKCQGNFKERCRKNQIASAAFPFPGELHHRTVLRGLWHHVNANGHVSSLVTAALALADGTGRLNVCYVQPVSIKHVVDLL